MPQLNPYPWFPTLAFTWLVFLTVIPFKVMSHKFLNEPAPNTKQNPQSKSWTWVWH